MPMKLSIAQINPTVGAISANAKLICDEIKAASENNVDLIIFPELALTGYPLNDLVYEQEFLNQQQHALTQIRQATLGHITAIVGAVDFNLDILTHDRTCQKFNAAYVFSNGGLVGKRYKSLLPNYDVFHEQRYFTPASEIEPLICTLAGRQISIGIEICEDLWDMHYNRKISHVLVEKGAELLINISASPFEIDKFRERRRLVLEKVKQLKRPFIYSNLVGAQDEIIFDGHSFAYNESGQLIAEGAGFLSEQVSFSLTDLPIQQKDYTTEDELLYNALVLGLRDYFRKNGLKKAVLGLSGGVDSALVAALSADAIGAKNVLAISLPSRYSSDHSKSDAALLAKNFGLAYQTIEIEPYHALFKDQYAHWFADNEVSLADENLQARLRGLILMLFSNQQNRILLTTGNKTELALGYCTLYGDMNGAIAAIGDLSKQRVLSLCRYINIRYKKEMIPNSSITKAPSAELREGQVDPFNYDEISPLVELIIEGRKSKAELLALGHNSTQLDDLFKRIFNNEFKRFQASIILKVTSKSFGLGRLYPMTSHYKG